MANLNIEISELRLVVNRILDHIENDLGKARVTLDQDDYWDVADAERYDFTKTPENFEHGQLSDDWEFLSAILKHQDQAFALMLTHATPLLRRIGEQLRK
jgi:hypothetical protein